VADERYVYGGTDDALRAFDWQTGAEVWSQPIGVTGLGVDEGVLISRDDNRVVRRVDPATGAILWESAPDNEHLQSSDIAGFTTDTVILKSTVDPRSFVSYDLATGAQRWVRPVPESGGNLRADGSNVIVIEYSSGALTRLDPVTGVAQRSIVGVPTDITGFALVGPILAVVSEGDAGSELTVVPDP